MLFFLLDPGEFSSFKKNVLSPEILLRFSRGASFTKTFRIWSDALGRSFFVISVVVSVTVSFFFFVAIPLKNNHRDTRTAHYIYVCPFFDVE